MNTPESLGKIVPELIRRGLPADYAHRAAVEFADHHRDLIDELRRGGLCESEATIEASRRLGDGRILVKKTVREYQRRYRCGRWPLITFLLGPIPVLIAMWYAAAFSLQLVVFCFTKLGLTGAKDVDGAMTALPVEVKYAFLVTTFLLIPAVVMCGFARLARRAAICWQWMLLTACILGMFMGVWKWERIGPGSTLVMRDRQTLRQLDHPPKHDFVIVLWLPINSRACTWPEIRQFFFSNPVQPLQFLVPVGVAMAFLLRYRQLSRRTELCTLDGS